MEILWPYQDLSASWGLKARTDGVELYFNQSGIEREFRSFGMVEQWDTEEFAAFSQARPRCCPRLPHIGQGESGAELLLELEGSVRLVVGILDAGTGVHVIHKQIVAEILGIEPERVFVQVSDTNRAPYHDGIKGQGATHVTGRPCRGRRWL